MPELEPYRNDISWLSPVYCDRGEPRADDAAATIEERSQAGFTPGPVERPAAQDPDAAA